MRQRGFALLIVLWTVGFLALLGSRIVAAGRSDTQLADNLKQEAVLRAAADGAVAHVVFQMVALKSPAFRPDGIERELRIGQTPGQTPGRAPVRVLVRVENESDRINLNTAPEAMLRALLIETGSAPAVAARVTTGIVEWRAAAGASARANEAKKGDYRAAGRAYGPPGTPFQSVAELADVLGVTPDMYARLAPHLTVLTDGDPDQTTRDPVVARVLADAAGSADVAGVPQETTDPLLRITVTALGADATRYTLLVVASADFRNTAPRVNILLREHGSDVTTGVVAALHRQPDTTMQ
jgi:general secretion pathway protein K